MGRLCLWSGVLLLVMTASGYAAPRSARWYSWLNPFKKAEPQPQRSDPKKAAAATAVEPAAVRQARQAREKADWLRRSAVCDKLMDIAIDTNDEQLRRWAEDLNVRAWDMYMKRLDQQPMSPIGHRDLPASNRAAQRREPVDVQAEQSRSPGPRARGAGQD